MTVTPSTVVLRFRDLVTAPGGTIAQHAEIAQSKGAVWWGWWNKSGEAVAHQTFRAFKASMGTVLLFDSGHLALWRATCTDIRWDTSGDPIASPDPLATPEYYKTQSYRMWFKFESIQQENDTGALLNQLTYVQADDFFANNKSSYAPFYGKRIYDLDELKQQDRTIWFARKYEQGDAIHQVSLLSQHRVTPSNFTTDYEGSKSANILWLSDLHCGPHHAFATESGAQRKTLAVEVETAAKSHGVSDFGAIIVSGDLTWSGTRPEFEDAQRLLRNFARSPSALDSYRIAIVPGNHDLKFSDDPTSKDAPVTANRDESRHEYEAFYKELFYVSPNEYLSMGRRYLLRGVAPVEIVCLNSSFLQQERGWFQGHGFVGVDQINDVIKKFEWTTDLDAPRPFRIVVMHHHLIPTALVEEPTGGRSYSVTLDAERLMRAFTKYRVDLVLHGHMHNVNCARLRRPLDVTKPDGEWHELTIVGLGSSGVDSSHRDSGSHNMFGVISVKSSSVLIRIFSVHPGDDESKPLLELSVPRTPVGGT